MSIILTLAAAIAQPPAPAPEPLTPAGPWKVEYAPAHCVLSRPFGAAAERLTLVVSGDWIADSYTLSIIGPETDGTLRRGRVNILFTDTPLIEAAAESSLNVALKMRVLTVRAEGASIAKTERIQLMPLSGNALRSAIFLATGVMAKPWQAFELCRTDLAKKWGVDPESLSRIAEPAKASGNPGEFFGPEDYPAAAKALRIGGEVAARLAVDATGRPVGCHIVKPSALASLDAETCAIVLQHVRYIPAKDKHGIAVSSDIPLKVTWRLAS